MKYYPSQGRILVRPIQLVEESVKGIVLPASMLTTVMPVEIVRVGPADPKANRDSRTTEGNKVLISVLERYSMVENGEKVLLINDEDILAYIE